MSLGSGGNVRVSTVHTYNISNVLYVCYTTSTCIPLCTHNDFLISLGMVRRMQVDRTWDKRQLAYNKYMASLLLREIYYRLQRLLPTDVTDIIEDSNAPWSAAWEIGGAVCGEETVLSHTSGRRLGLRQCIAHKPPSSGIKLYVLRTMGAGRATSLTSSPTPGVAARAAAVGHVAASMIPRVSCAYGRR